MRGKFRVLMDIEIERMRIGVDAIDFFRSGLSGGCDGDEQAEQREFAKGHGPGS
jgi:hypothetical protein